MRFVVIIISPQSSNNVQMKRLHIHESCWMHVNWESITTTVAKDVEFLNDSDWQ